jgi:hypothetical protein
MRRREVGENCIMMSFITWNFAKYDYNYQVKEGEMGRSYRTHGVE